MFGLADSTVILFDGLFIQNYIFDNFYFDHTAVKSNLTELFYFKSYE